MTKLLESALEKIKLLPDNEQDEIANLILDEVPWDVTFENSKDKLKRMAEKALTEHSKSKTTDLSF